MTLPIVWNLALVSLSPVFINLREKRIWMISFPYTELTIFSRKLLKIRRDTAVTSLNNSLWMLFYWSNFRIWMEKQTSICEDLLWHSNIWQNHQGQSSKVCGHVVSYWRHHGTSHWVLHHQWSGDYLLHYQKYCQTTIAQK